MEVEEFRAAHRPAWIDLARVVASVDANRGTDDERRRLASLHRSAVTDLAVARRAFPGDGVIAELEELVTASRACLYGRRPPGLHDLRRLLTRELWAAVAADRAALAAAGALLVLGGIGGTAWAAIDADGAAVVLSVPARRALADGELAELAGPGTAVLAVAGGLILGAGTAWAVGGLGLAMGVVAGTAMGGDGPPGTAPTLALVPLVATVAVVLGAAGFRVARAVAAALAGERPAAALAETGPGAALAVAAVMPLAVAAFAIARAAPSTSTIAALAAGLSVVFWTAVLFVTTRPPPPRTGSGVQ